MDSSEEPVATRVTPERLTKLFFSDTVAAPSREGYVDTLPGEGVAPPGRAQAAWQTEWGSRLYQQIQPRLAPLFSPSYRTVARQLGLKPGDTVADVGCGPGHITADLAAAVGPHGLAVGLDLSAPMLTHAASHARPNLGLVRADATRLPLREASVDAACATAVIMLVPEPAEALAELVRVVAPGGWLLVMVPVRPSGITAPFTVPLMERMTRYGGVRLFTADELAVLLEQLGCYRLHSHQQGPMLTLRARTPTDTTTTNV